MRQVLTPKEAAEALGVTDRTIRRWVTEGKLEAVSLPSGRIRIPAEAVSALLAPRAVSGSGPGEAA